MMRNKELKIWAALLIILQVLDGLFTFWGIENFGTKVEGNPLVKSLIESWGPEQVLITIKLFAVGIIIFLMSQKALKPLIFIAGAYVAVVYMWFRFWCHVVL